MNKRITIKDIAKKTGFSYSTVSRVLNNIGKYYSMETGEEIIEAAKKMHYIPNSLAKSLKIQKTRIIAYLTPGDQNYYFSIYRGISRISDENGYNISIFISYYDKDKEKLNIRTLLSNKVDGVIISSMFVSKEQIDILKSHGLPIVIIDREEKFEGVSNIIIKNKEATSKATKYLIDKGYKNIFYISGPLENLNYRERYMGFKEAFKRIHIQNYESNIYIFKDFYWLKGDYTKTYKLLENLINENKDIDALFLISSTMPIFALRILNKLKLRVPEDVAVLGFNETQLTKFLQPAITSIVNPTEEMGSQAMRILLDMINNPAHIENLELEPKLLIREST